MTVRPPGYLSGGRAAETPQSALDYEIAQEKASTLGRLGRRLEEALAALRQFDSDSEAEAASDAGAPREGAGTRPPASDRSEERRALVNAAGKALWHLVVQREVLGLRDNAGVMRDYGVPDEVRNRAGVTMAVPPMRRRPPRG